MIELPQRLNDAMARADYPTFIAQAMATLEQYDIKVASRDTASPEPTHTIARIHGQHRIDITLIEDADLGRGIAAILNRSSPICRTLLVRPKIDKIARMQARLVMFETGKNFLPREAPWLAVYLDELLGFPNRVHADQVDSTSQALDYFQLRHSGRVTPERAEFKRKRPPEFPRPPGRKRR